MSKPYIWLVIIAAVVALIGLGTLIAFRIRAQEAITGPARLDRFLSALAATDWSAKRSEAPGKIAVAIVKLFRNEIAYYHLLRNRRARVAGLSRMATFIFGTAGLLAPLLAATGNQWFVNWDKWGYVLLASAAAALAANQLFGATSGHMRFVSAQYALEQLLQEFAVHWQAWRAKFARADEAPNAELTAEAFLLFQQLSTAAYAAIKRETDLWSASLAAAEAQYGQMVAR
ncbi:MAG: hypothetical protein QOH47_1313 [Sphingomonadales bacterium]|jgi:hypothetical protein|nr:hypothetical protein [Sphingomonadales bacterium]